MQTQHNPVYDYYQIDLMAEIETNETSLKDVDLEKQRLKEENRMKQKALDKASALIDLLNVELAVSRKTFQQTIEDLKNKITQQEHQQFKYREQIKGLEQRNSFLEFQCRKKAPPLEAKMSHSSSRTSFKSAGRTPFDQNIKTVVKAKRSDSFSRISPPIQKKKSEDKDLTLEYFKTFVQEYINQDYQQNSLINNLIQRENTIYDNIVEKLGENKPYLQTISCIKSGLSREAEEVIIQKMQSFKSVILDQQSIILSMKKVNQHYKHIVNDFISNIKMDSIDNNKIISMIKNIDELFSIKSRQVKNKIIVSASIHTKKNSYELDNLVQKVDSYSKFNNEIKLILDVSPLQIINLEEILNRIKQLKGNQARLIQENKQLISITDGLLKYIKY